MLKYRLIFGTLMAALFIGLVIFDAFLDGTMFDSVPDKSVQGTIFWLLVMGLTVPVQLELGALVKNTGATLIKTITIPAGMMLVSSWYFRQFSGSYDQIEFQLYYMLFVLSFAILGLFVVQAFRFGTDGVISNCSVSLLAILYLGFLGSFFLGIRDDFGYLGLLMFVTVVKCSDIGAYTIGKIFGKHKFVPRISPGKTWEGLGGAVLFAAIVSFVFGVCCDIMSIGSAIVFGVVFGFLGQCADLAESMIKRDAEQKDSSASVPGFGGLLDVLDSPLATAPLAYLFFMFAVNK